MDVETPQDDGEIRCPLCDRKPLLATYGFDERGELYIHVKVWKGQEVKADVYFTGGIVTLKCYRCMRFNRVRIHGLKPSSSRARRPSIDDGW